MNHTKVGEMGREVGFVSEMSNKSSLPFCASVRAFNDGIKIQEH